MTTGGTREKTMNDYRQSLILALRLKDVPGDRIGEIVAQVESHVADTGEDPTDAFGTPKHYASAVTAGGPREAWWRTVIIIALPAFVAGWFLAQGVLAVLLGETYLAQPGWFWVALGLGLCLPTALIVRRRSSRVRDPRTGADMVPISGWTLVGFFVIPMVPILLAWAAIALFN